jgi:hypothetical protein
MENITISCFGVLRDHTWSANEIALSRIATPDEDHPTMDRAEYLGVGLIIR